ncbi:MAG: RagB/SusD family nutrient uptake outer membrane protein [Cyclobacteriaceae bacterium]|nr:RagB/SusD family nutrient uptake outer membrane protein [Cyclobacteriaceae bacterium HetDA_MAG_MS6]
MEKIDFGRSTLVSTPDLQALFDLNDPRLAESLDTATLAIRKYVNRAASPPPFLNDYNNARILRYADILLMKAWAIHASGGDLSESIRLVNEVRTRARDFGGVGSSVPANYPETESDASVILNWILNERRMELAFEAAHRWVDMRILFLTGQLDLPGYDFGDPTLINLYQFQSHHINFPFPREEVNATGLRQNSGYVD